MDTKKIFMRGFKKSSHCTRHCIGQAREIVFRLFYNQLHPDYTSRRIIKLVPRQQILIPRTSPCKFSKTSPKDPIWPFWRRPDLTFRGHTDMTSRGRTKIKSRDNIIRSPRDVLKRLIREIPKKFWGPPLDNLQNMS